MHGNVSGFSMDLWRRKTPAKNFLRFTLLNDQRIWSDPSKSEISCCSRSAAQLCLTLCDPMDCSTRGFPVPPSPRACSNSCPCSQWCSPTISSSVAPFSSCPQSFPASESFPMSQLFVSDGQSAGRLGWRWENTHFLEAENLKREILKGHLVPWIPNICSQVSSLESSRNHCVLDSIPRFWLVVWVSAGQLLRKSEILKRIWQLLSPSNLFALQTRNRSLEWLRLLS